MAELPSFLELVQIHERRWGDVQYPGRPSLKDLMTAPIVALWITGKRFILSTHADRKSLDQLVQTVLTGGFDDRRQLAGIYIGQESVSWSASIEIRPAVSVAEVAPTTIAAPQIRPVPASIPGSGIIRTPAGDKVRPGRQVKWQPGRNAVKFYKYQCATCGVVFEAVAIDGKPRCPSCGDDMKLDQHSR